MYATCLHCHGALGANEEIEAFPVGRPLAFDAAKGRLWVICPHCARWNLSPLEERWEAIEECERRYRETTRRVSDAEIGLASLPSGLELVRIGRPLRPEFAAWRYGRELSGRHSRSWLRRATQKIDDEPELRDLFTGALWLAGRPSGSLRAVRSLVWPSCSNRSAGNVRSTACRSPGGVCS